MNYDIRSSNFVLEYTLYYTGTYHFTSQERDEEHGNKSNCDCTVPHDYKLYISIQVASQNISTGIYSYSTV